MLANNGFHEVFSVPSYSSISRFFSNPPDVVVDRRPIKRRSTFDKIARAFFYENVEDYKPPPVIPNQKTLILDLDETLIHSSSFPPHPNVSSFKHPTLGQFIFLRPGLEMFLSKVTKEFDVFIYTYSDYDYANPIINVICPQIDKNHRLFRDSCCIETGKVYKDIDMVGRPKEEILIVDDNPAISRFHPDNAIQIDKWTGSPDDKALNEWLYPLLEKINNGTSIQSVIKGVRYLKKRCISNNFLPSFYCQ